MTDLRTTFGRFVGLYDEMRPGYPQSLFADIVSLTGLQTDGTVLEIGFGTGQATKFFAENGNAVDGYDIDQNMTDFARQKFSGEPRLSFRCEAFEHAQLPDEHYDLVISATAFHWLAPEEGLAKVAAALRPHGYFGPFRNYHQFPTSGFFEAVQACYREHAPDLAREPDPADPTGVKRTESSIERVLGEIRASGCFGATEVRRYGWTAEYTPEQYVRLLSTYSGHINLERQARKRLFRSIEQLVRTEFGSVKKQYLAVLWLSQRRSA